MSAAKGCNMEWTSTESGGCVYHHAQTDSANLTVYERKGFVTWTVYDRDDKTIIAGGKSASVDKAKSAAEAAA
jgi:hypothetical protein